jgi:hypothetical protein
MSVKAEIKALQKQIAGRGAGDIARLILNARANAHPLQSRAQLDLTAEGTGMLAKIAQARLRTHLYMRAA